MTQTDVPQWKAFVRMMAQPDPTDLPRRSHVYRYEGDPNRRLTRLPAIHMAWLQRRHLEVDVEDPIAPARRKWNRQTPDRNRLLLCFQP